MLSRLVLSVPKVTCLSGRVFSNTAAKGARYGGNTSFRFGNSSGIGVKTGPTLKERLLGPTTGKPFLYGTYAIAGASVVGVGALMYYGLVSRQQSILQNSALWPTYVRERISTTYAYLGSGLAVTAAGAVAATRSPAIMRLSQAGGIMGVLGTMAVIIGTSMLCQSISYENTIPKHLAWMLHCGAMGAVLAPLCYLGGPVLIRAAWYTAGIVAGLSATAITAPSEKFLMMSGPLGMGLGVVFMANIGALFAPAGSALGAGLMSVVMYGGLILFSAFLLYDTQKVIKRAEIHPNYSRPAYDPINAQISLYMDILNIFMRLAMIMGMNNNRRK